MYHTGKLVANLVRSTLVGSFYDQESGGNSIYRIGISENLKQPLGQGLGRPLLLRLFGNVGSSLLLPLAAHLAYERGCRG